MKNERGFSLIEVMIAIALLGIIGVAFLGGLATASKAIFIADERATAESLARSQMESIKSLDYIPASDGDEAIYAKIVGAGIPDGYTIWSVNRAGDIVNGGDDDGVIGIPWDSDADEAVPDDDGLQRMKLVVKHGTEPETAKEVITLEGYKVER